MSDPVSESFISSGISGVVRFGDGAPLDSNLNRRT